jgi:hypothetical protein
MYSEEGTNRRMGGSDFSVPTLIGVLHRIHNQVQGDAIMQRFDAILVAGIEELLLLQRVAYETAQEVERERQPERPCGAPSHVAT